MASIKELPKRPEETEFEYAKRNIKNLIETTNDLLPDIAELVSASEHPRVIEVYANLIRTIVDANKSLLDIKDKEISILLKVKKESGETKKEVDDGKLYCSTSELLKKI